MEEKKKKVISQGQINWFMMKAPKWWQKMFQKVFCTMTLVFKVSALGFSDRFVDFWQGGAIGELTSETGSHLTFRNEHCYFSF